MSDLGVHYEVQTRQYTCLRDGPTLTGAAVGYIVQ